MVGIKTYSINKDYEMERNLGFGSYGEVKLGRHRKTNRAVAIKKIPISD
jgi:serine/threonine protein kinase